MMFALNTAEFKSYSVKYNKYNLSQLINLFTNLCTYLFTCW